MKIICGKDFYIQFDMLFFAALPVVIAAGYVDKYLMTLGVAFLHETAHMVMALFLGERPRSLQVMAVGLNAGIEEKTCDKYGRLLIYASGPLMNFITAACLLLVNTYYLFYSDNMRFFILINLYMGIFNIFPIMPLDGGKIFREILQDRIGIYSTRAYSRKLSGCLAFIVTVIGAVQLYYTSNNFSLLIIGLYIFFTLKSGEEEAAFMNVKNVVYRRSRLMKKGVYPARDLVVMKGLHLSELMKSMDFDRFHIIHVLDEDLRLLRTFTEQEILDGMMKHNADISFEEFIKLQK